MFDLKLKCRFSAFALFTAFVCIASTDISAQKVKDEEVKFVYHKLPSAPLNPSYKNYQSYVIAAWEEQNEKIKVDHKQKVVESKEKYQKDLAEHPNKVVEAKESHAKAVADHPAKVKEVQARYDKEMEDYKKISAGDKLAERVVTGSAIRKPELRLPSEPQLYIPSEPSYSEPSMPTLSKSYDYPVLASTYLKLQGFNKAANDAVKVTVTMQGFEMNEPIVISEPRNVITKGVTQQVMYYSLEYSYRHPMSIKVELPDGNTIMNSTPEELNNFVVVKTSSSNKQPVYSKDALMKTAEEKILQRNLFYLDSLVNDQYGFGLHKREVEISYVKGDEYADLMQAFNEATSALLQLENNEKEGLEALNHPIEVWEKNFAEYTPGAKKARIDEDAAFAISFNLLEAFYLKRDEVKMQAIIQKLNGMDLSSKKRKIKATYDLLLSDLKKRKAVQKG